MSTFILTFHSNASTQKEFYCCKRTLCINPCEILACNLPRREKRREEKKKHYVI